MRDAQRLLEIGLLGGHPALDFVNTLDWRGRGDGPGGAEECLLSYAGLLAWMQRLRLATSTEAQTVSAAAATRPQKAQAMLREAVALREAIHGLFAAAMARRRPKPADLARLNRWLGDQAPLRLEAKAGGYVWAEEKDGQHRLGLPLHRLALQAAELLTSDKLERVRCCAGPGCGWLFLDTSPNRQRRWCSMEGCGNRAKAKRHYSRVSGRQK
ncbi:MAG TPA: ABATE domain-containing protein [Ferrovibrio sp.]|uniref:CGNR zinc finger domain-containing protein n=1 Tax=Ferrovibrio sp. TaxID=1917215 RepID=UPI002ED4FCBE